MSNEKLVMTENEKQVFWTGHVAKWNDSGLSQAEYCRQNKLNPNLLSKWKQNLKDGEIKDFVEIPVSAIENESVIELVVRDIYKVQLKDGFDPNLLKKVIKVLEKNL